ERRSSRRGTALAQSCSCSVRNNQGTNRRSVCAEIVGGEAVMGSLVVIRGISDLVAHWTVRAGGAGYPTARWQDKSRSLRLGRAAEECRHINHLARGATVHDSLPIRTSPCNFTTPRTSSTS